MIHKPENIYSTTILAVKNNGVTVIAGDGQVTLGNVVMKNSANKLRTLNNGNIVGGFAPDHRNRNINTAIILIFQLSANLANRIRTEFEPNSN
jgi:ATP-dependent HslUV protease subunit HslV